MLLYRIISQTDDFIIIDKSFGISVHRDQSVMGLIMQLESDFQTKEIYPVHRLDKVTSGIMLLARNKQTAAKLSNLFKIKQIEKYYLAISHKNPRRKQGIIKGDMKRSRRGGWQLLKQYTNPAETQFYSTSLIPGSRLFLLRPFTGKTHQIRVALKSEAAVIAGDTLYGGKKLDRVYLHSYRLKFKLDDKEYSYTCLPEQGELFNLECLVKIREKYSCPEELKWSKVL